MFQLVLVAWAILPPSILGYESNDAHYKFGYGVNDPNTHDVKHHQEERHGDNVIGAYSIQAPDGTFRVVKYNAGPESGFQATVEEVDEHIDEYKRQHPRKKHVFDDIGSPLKYSGYDPNEHELRHHLEDPEVHILKDPDGNIQIINYPGPSKYESVKDYFDYHFDHNH
ncbi:hypothetical protein NQ317_015173 [Molorchus minor]|uniref:Uncharacterized protein n=1 Tax=Molorchus minor TaxID=1323400 RepID=A0ABQ9K6N8_9CUCU|nr:hypothetical protein NQ317_015173 [Molorchus minor]